MFDKFLWYGLKIREIYSHFRQNSKHFLLTSQTAQLRRKSSHDGYRHCASKHFQLPLAVVDSCRRRILRSLLYAYNELWYCIRWWSIVFFRESKSLFRGVDSAKNKVDSWRQGPSLNFSGPLAHNRPLAYWYVTTTQPTWFYALTCQRCYWSYSRKGPWQIEGLDNTICHVCSTLLTM